jgi:hypothetical protein
LCGEGEVKKRKKQRILALRESRNRKKSERSSTALPPGPVILPKPVFAAQVGRVLHEHVHEEQDTVGENVLHYFGKSPPSSPWERKEKDSEDDTDSTAASSDKEAYSPLSPKIGQPVVLRRDVTGTLFMTTVNTIDTLGTELFSASQLA